VSDVGGKRVTATDAVVGEHIRAFRKAVGVSQTELGKRIGVTFQQVQKYENGTNRVGAGRLTQIARALDVPVSALFDGFAQPARRRVQNNAALDEVIAQPGARKLLEAFNSLPDPLQIALLELARSLRTAKKRRAKING
jgi:transcriptional regulator with XRE-family HTH domain